MISKQKRALDKSSEQIIIEFMKTALKIISSIVLLCMTYIAWAGTKWIAVDNETGVLETCRWKTIDGVNNYDCLITLSNGESGAIKSFVLDDESHKQVTVKVEENKLRKKRKRYTFISSS